MQHSARKDVLIPALCGKKFNHGFAIAEGNEKHCFNCQRRLKK